MWDWSMTAAVALGCAILLNIGWHVGYRAAHPLPPGPPGLPWLGNVIGVNLDAPWKTYAQWARSYGDIIYSRLLGKDIIIINSEKMAKDLLENRSWNYSDRPYLITVGMTGLDFHSGFVPYGDRWRSHRRFFHQTYRIDAARRFLPLHHKKSCHFIRKLFKDPEGLKDHLFEYTASVILKSTYDYDPPSREDELLDIVANVLKIIAPVLRPDIAVVGTAFPFLLKLPSWLPGMSFKKEMETARIFSKQYVERPFECSVQKPISSDSASMLHDAFRGMEDKGIIPNDSWKEMLKEACGSAFLAASETSTAVLMTFFLMMMLNPSAQKKAQAQIDAVVGREKLPTTDHRPLLPVLDAILWEVLRYSPVGPLGLPRVAMSDDVYCGFHIPKGAIILINHWSIAHSESRYTNPHDFIPERFLNEDGSLKRFDVEHITYGFGRRMCPGRHFADASVWSVIAKVLAVFEILKPLDENGAEIAVQAKFTGDLTVHPFPFKCRIVPRFPNINAEKLEELIAASAA